jgi:hypothetical protein
LKCLEIGIVIELCPAAARRFNDHTQIAVVAERRKLQEIGKVELTELPPVSEIRIWGLEQLVESESEKCNLYTFECIGCGVLEVRGVQVR